MNAQDKISNAKRTLQGLARLDNAMAATYLYLLINAESEADALRIIDQINMFVVGFAPPWKAGPGETK